MKTVKGVIIGAFALLLASAIQTFGIDTGELQRVSADQVPKVGTFWLANGPFGYRGKAYPPLPCLPSGLPDDIPIYVIGSGQFLVDDSEISYTAKGKPQSMARASTSFSEVPSPEDGEEPSESEFLQTPDLRRNYAKFKDQVFSILDTNAVAVTDTNLFNALAAFADDGDTNPVLQIALYGSDSVIIKASHFDYSAETDRDFALLICDKVETPVWKSIDFFGVSDSQDGWLVQGSVPNWKVTDPMYFQVSNITHDANAFFRVIPYGGAQISLSGPQPYDVVSNTITLQSVISDLSGITNELFEVTVDGLPARYSLETNNAISLNTKYNPNGSETVYLKTFNRARVCNLTNAPDNSKIFFSGITSLPLDFENDTYLLFSSDHASPEIGTNYFLFVIDKAQDIEATISDPLTGQVVASFAGHVPFPATIQLDWNFTQADGVTPYSNNTYHVSFTAFDPTTLDFTNSISRDGVRPGAGCFLTYQEEDPSDLFYGPTGNYLNQKAEMWIEQTLKTLYQDLYKPLSFTQYGSFQVGTNRNHSDCTPLSPGNPEWAAFMQPALTNLIYSDLTIAQAHGNGVTVGGGSYLLNKFSAIDLNNWLINGEPTNKWRLRKAAIWTCFSGSVVEETGNVGFPQACGIRPTAVQNNSFTRKNCGLFFGGLLDQAWMTDNETITTARAAAELDQLWICGKDMYPGGCDPTYSFRWAVQRLLNRHAPLSGAEPRFFGCPQMIYSSVYDDELARLDFTHVKEN